MGVLCSCSCPLAARYDLENGFESIIVKPVDLFGDDDRKLQTIDSEKSLFDEIIMRAAGVGAGDKCVSILDPNSPQHEAAVKLQKVYKSFRTRRKLADCAVLIEQSWWKLLDFAELKHSSISFFDTEKHETAVSRWSRARTRAAKVGKGLSKNGKARKLALQHWLEAIDPRHRYGHNLHFYYVKWLNSQSKEPFFYWLDIGEGREVNIVEKCPRSKLQQQCIKYLGPMERKAYEIVMDDGKLFYKQTGEVLDTTKEPKGSKWIFVLSTSKSLYVGKKKKGSFQHSSFLAGGATLAAGRIVAENGVLKAVWPHSGHYRPTPENFQDCLSFLRENDVDLTNVKLVPTDEEDEDSSGKKLSLYLRSNSSDENLAEKDRSETQENKSKPNSDKITPMDKNTAKSRDLHGFGKKLTALEIPSKENFLKKMMSENQVAESIINDISPPGSPVDGYETAEESFATKTDDEEIIPEEHILRRIKSHKDLKSFQLGKHLSCKWSTGAGPRIGCVRDYPSGLQCHALEQVDLSPRIERGSRLEFLSSPISSRLFRSSSCDSAMHSSL